MLQIILLILKIIGILLLSVIGLLILALLVVLLVPIRYKLHAEHGEVIRVDGRASWVLHLLRARLTYMEDTLYIRVKLLCFTLYDSRDPKPPKDRNRKKPGKAATKKFLTDPDIQDEEEIPTEPDGQAEADSVVETKDYMKTEGMTGSEKQVLSEGMGEQKKEAEQAGRAIPEVDDEADAQKKSIVQKLKDKLKRILEGIKAFFRGMKEKIIRWFQTVVNIRQKIRLVSDFIKDEINREGFKITYTGLKKLLKHILPRKLNSRIVFGTGDPCSTGQALGAMGILYSFYGDKVTIIPDFENKVLEGKHYARGRIRIITILIIVIKLIKDKRFQSLKKNFLILKEAL